MFDAEEHPNNGWYFCQLMDVQKEKPHIERYAASVFFCPARYWETTSACGELPAGFVFPGVGVNTV